MKYDNNRPPMAVILADGIGSLFSPMTDSSAKCLLPVGGSAILERIIRNCLSCGMSQFVLVLGHRADDVKQFVNKTFRGIRITYVINDKYRETNTSYALMCAASAVGSAEFIKLDAGTLFDVKILRQLVDDDRPNVVCIDRNATLDDADVGITADEQMRVLEIGRSVDHTLTVGQSIGLEKISAKTGPLLFAELALMMENPARFKDDCDTAYTQLINKGTIIHALDITGSRWTPIETAEDYAVANAMFRSPITTVSRGQQRALDEEAATAATKQSTDRLS